MDAEAFENVVAAMARRQSERLRGMGFGVAADEVDRLIEQPVTVPEVDHTASVAC